MGTGGKRLKRVCWARNQDGVFFLGGRGGSSKRGGLGSQVGQGWDNPRAMIKDSALSVNATPASGVNNNRR